MKHLAKFSFLPIIIFTVSLFITIPVLAIPSLPSSFYGTVRVNNANVPDGTIIQGLIGGQVYAEGFTQTYQGGSVYALDVRGDNTDTPTQDGGREGDTIQFKIGGVLTDQTGVWHAGTNVNLNLTASSSAPIIAPQTTPLPVPTQTAIVFIQPLPTSTQSSQASPTPTVLAQSSPAVANPAKPSPTSTTQIQPSPMPITIGQPSPMPTTQVESTPIPIPSEKENGSNNTAQVTIFIIVVLVAIVVGYTFWTSRKKKM